MTKEARKQIVADFRSGALQGVSSCDIISEGFDLPDAAVAILLRPTKSLGLFMQQVGRVLRISPGKTHATVIDHVCNVGKTVDGKFEINHGFIEQKRNWSLKGEVKSKNSTIPCKRCPECYALNPISVQFCTECGHEFIAKVEDPKPSDGIIAEFDREAIMAQIATRLEDWIKAAKFPEVLRWARTEEQLRQVADIRGYKPQWINVILESRSKWAAVRAVSEARCP
jgi:ribosomal protein L40E